MDQTWAPHGSRSVLFRRIRRRGRLLGEGQDLDKTSHLEHPLDLPRPGNDVKVELAVARSAVQVQDHAEPRRVDELKTAQVELDFLYFASVENATELRLQPQNSVHVKVAEKRDAQSCVLTRDVRAKRRGHSCSVPLQS